jgi:hypothetical protein
MSAERSERGTDRSGAPFPRNAACVKCVIVKMGVPFAICSPEHGR